MKRIPALDGLRGGAVLLVLAFHAWPEQVPAGSFGVIVFFTLSGYLITRILVAEKDETGGVDFRRFFSRRVRRLVPGLLTVLVVFVVVSGRWDLSLPPLLYYQNIHAVVGGEWSLMHHAWSLAVEEHFYLLWPFVVAVMPAHRRRAVIGGLLLVAVAWRSALVVGGHIDWAYYGTDANAFAILAGCFLAVSPAPQRLRMIASGAAAAVVLLALLPAVAHKTSPYFWAGLLVVAATCAVIRWSTVEGRGWLTFRPLRYVGQVSYGLYLWHYLLIRMDMLSPWAAVGIAVGLSVLMWHLVERPILAGSQSHFVASRSNAVMVRPESAKEALVTPASGW